MQTLDCLFYDMFLDWGVSESTATYLNMLTLLVISLVAVFLIDALIRRVLRQVSANIANRTKSSFDDILIANKLPRNVAHIIPVLLFSQLIPIIFRDFERASTIMKTTLTIFGIMLTLWIVRSILNSIKDYLKQSDNFRDKPIDSYIQVFMIFAWLIGVFAALAIITGLSFIKFAGTLGAASAIIILIFKDTILGFVASIQVSINDMVRIGDWITFEKYGADGDVIEINLATVKVQNWDMTITTIPTYALISDSFKNWRGMKASGGRRIKRSVIIKASTIRFLQPEDLSKFKKIQLVSNYISNKEAEINSHNSSQNIDKSVLINGRNLTNFGVFRKYLNTYIENHSAINKDMTMMVRQLEPTPQGIPMEIYAFSKDQRWENYEHIMGEIFDHVLAAVPYFDLEVFELYPVMSMAKT
ncbi:mechanosensitive ion channel [Winogradskyella maritima]|uniref:Mechanosensitive ion channel family protein n=1 Tax=Winogradskyella maritima TaxID=1517766 RepID=A0ABV8AJX5_9FLAO|nr:mechanosensitive ion channel [Winogradskyella maritima]